MGYYDNFMPDYNLPDWMTGKNIQTLNPDAPNDNGANPPPQDTGGGGGSAPAPPPDPWATPPSKDISQEEWDRFRKDNPGDEGRWSSAFAKKGGGGGMGASGAGGLAPSNGFFDKINAYLDKVLANGGYFDWNMVNKRRESVKDILDMARVKQQRNLNDQLAAKGLLSTPGNTSGVQRTSYGDLESQLGSTYSGAMRDIISQEEAAADSRIMQALGLMSGTANNAAGYDLGLRNIDLGLRNIDLQQMLGLGNLALGQGRLSLDSQLGLGRLELDRAIEDAKQKAAQGGSIQDLIDAIMKIVNASQAGHH